MPSQQDQPKSVVKFLEAEGNTEGRDGDRHHPKNTNMLKMQQPQPLSLQARKYQMQEAKQIHSSIGAGYTAESNDDFMSRNKFLTTGTSHTLTMNSLKLANTNQEFDRTILNSQSIQNLEQEDGHNRDSKFDKKVGLIGNKAIDAQLLSNTSHFKKKIQVAGDPRVQYRTANEKGMANFISSKVAQSQKSLPIRGLNGSREHRRGYMNYNKRNNQGMEALQQTV